MTCPAPTRSTGRPEPTRPRILTRPLALRFVSVVASSIGFFLPLGVVPLYAAQSGTAATGGLATGALLLTTVGVELLSPRIIRVSDTGGPSPSACCCSAHRRSCSWSRRHRRCSS